MFSPVTSLLNTISGWFSSPAIEPSSTSSHSSKTSTYEGVGIKISYKQPRLKVKTTDNPSGQLEFQNNALKKEKNKLGITEGEDRKSVKRKITYREKKIQEIQSCANQSEEELPDAQEERQHRFSLSKRPLSNDIKENKSLLSDNILNIKKSLQLETKQASTIEKLFNKYEKDPSVVSKKGKLRSNASHEKKFIIHAGRVLKRKNEINEMQKLEKSLPTSLNKEKVLDKKQKLKQQNSNIRKTIEYLVDDIKLDKSAGTLGPRKTS